MILELLILGVLVVAYSGSHRHHHRMELWKLTRGPDRNWLLADIYRGPGIASAIRAAKQGSSARRSNATGAVRKVG